jgi:hypothetical protein
MKMSTYRAKWATGTKRGPIKTKTLSLTTTQTGKHNSGKNKTEQGAPKMYLESFSK